MEEEGGIEDAEVYLGLEKAHDSLQLEGDFLPQSEFGIEPPFEPEIVFDVIGEEGENLFETSGEQADEDENGEEMEEQLGGEEEVTDKESLLAEEKSTEEMEGEGEKTEELSVEQLEEEEFEGSEEIEKEGEEEQREKELEGEEEQEEEGGEEEEEGGEEEEEGGEEGAEKGEEKIIVEKPKGVQFGADEEGTEDVTKPKTIKRRMSIRKKSIFYPNMARFQRMDERRISGDFKALDKDELLGISTSPPSIASFEPEEEEFWYEEEIEEEEIPIDREHYYNIHKSLIEERNTLKLKNNFLQRKMAEYFKKRKMEYVLKESDQQTDSQYKYDKKLDALANLKELDDRERSSITSELDDMKYSRDEQLSVMNNHFINMQNREKEIGTGLINTKTGKEIPDKMLERLLKRQKHKWNEVASMRLKYIKIRDRVNEKKAALQALDCIGENLHLIDFEQLKVEHQSHTDKIEERDEELTKLRVKCSNAVQCLAHVREKSAAATIDLQQLNERLEDVNMEHLECRERMNYFKQERDLYRLETEKLIEESGLLCKPRLLQDMESSMKELEMKTKQLDELKAENERMRDSLNAIKKNISMANLKGPKSKEKMIAKGEKSKSKRIYKGRPTLIYPEFRSSEWS